MISEQQFRSSAPNFHIELTAIKAITELENPDPGYLCIGQPKLLFLQLIFYKILRDKKDLNQ